MTNARDDQQQPETPAPRAPQTDGVVEPQGVEARSGEAPGVEAQSVVEHDEVTVRRAPKFPVFLIVGAALGVIVSLVVTSLFPFDSGEGVAQTYGYIALWGLTIGGAVGCVVAIVAERVTARGARQVQVERERLELPVDDEGSAPTER